jgi:hypothetical protein
MYFMNKPDRAAVLYDKVVSPVKKRLLRAFMPEEKEEELNERKSVGVDRSVVRKGPHRAFEPKSR